MSNPTSTLSEVGRAVGLALVEAGASAFFKLAQGGTADDALYAAQESIADARARARHSNYRETSG